jgi:CPA1 family monovalent cation:H+ antiporter
MISHTSAAEQGFATRLQSRSLWSVFSFVLEAAAFLILGLELPVLTRAVLDAPTGIPVIGVIAVVFATVVLSRIIWVFPATYLPRRLSPRIRRVDPAPSWQGVAVVSWAGIRGPVSLLAALGIPLTVDSGAPFPYRDLLLLVTGVVVLLTLIVQGLTLGPLIRGLGVRTTDRSADLLAEAEAQHHAARAGLTALDELLAAEATDPASVRPSDQVVETLRASAERRANGAWERLGGDAETPSDTYRRLRLAMLEAERHVFLTYRDSGRLSDRVLRQVFRDLDLEEASLNR